MLAPSSSQFGSSSKSLDHCSYRRHSCSRPRYLNYKYCAVHIAEDSQSPFTSCEYISRTTGRKCPNPALKPRKQNNLPLFCSEHLHDLIVKERHQKQKRKLRRKRKNEKLNQAPSKRTKLINKLYKFSKEGSKPQNELSYDSSVSDIEEVHRPIKDDWLLENAQDIATNADWDDFDPVNNEVYEPLRYADVLTPEEVVATAQSKLIRLQSLYIEQFKRLSHLLKERRRQYLHDRRKEMKLEKAAGGFARRDADLEENEEIHTLATYRKRTGTEALLRKRQLQQKQESDGNNSNFSAKSSAQRCAHVSHHTRCKGLCLPYTKYCTSHILEDPHQQLYRKCYTAACSEPVCQLTSTPYQIKINDESVTKEVCYCLVHAPLPDMTFTFPDITESSETMEVEVSGSQVIPSEPATESNPCASQSLSQDKNAMEVTESLVTSCDAKDTNATDTVTSESHESVDKKIDVPQDFEASPREQSDLPQIFPTPAHSDHTHADIPKENNEINSSTIATDCKALVEPGAQNEPEIKEDDDKSDSTRDCLADPSQCDASHEPAIENCGNNSLLSANADEISDTSKIIIPTVPSELEFSQSKEAAGSTSAALNKEDSINPIVASAVPNPVQKLEPEEEIGLERVQPVTSASSTAPLTTNIKPEGSSKPDDSIINQEQQLAKPDDFKDPSCCVPVPDDPSQNPGVNVLERDTYILNQVKVGESSATEHGCPKPDVMKSPTDLIKGAHRDSPSPVPAYISRGERKPSSAEEELAVVSLLQLHTGLASDENATSSTEQE